jgi:hypothetical protein
VERVLFDENMPRKLRRNSIVGPYFAGHQFGRILAGLIFVGLAGLSAPEVTAAQVLYVGINNTPGGVQVYNLPISGSSTPVFTIASNSVVAVDQDANGNLTVGDAIGTLRFFTAPLSGASTPSAVFKNGTAGYNGQLVFTPAGDFFASTGTTTTIVNKFTHPFSNASTPSQSITSSGSRLALGVALDAAQNLYISTSGGGSKLFVYAPPYTGAPIMTPAVSSGYRGIVVSGRSCSSRRPIRAWGGSTSTRSRSPRRAPLPSRSRTA